MNTDFLDAHERHLTDAEALHSAGRLANADHLYGLSAECGLKKLMVEFGMRYDSQNDRPQDVADQRHIDRIWYRYETYRQGRPAGSRYPLSTPAPFDNWNVSQRYSRQDQFDLARVNPHRAGAREVHRLIQQAQLEGLV